MDATIAWMIGRPSGADLPTERHLSHIRALRGAATPRRPFTERIVGAARSFRPAVGTASGPTLEVACCAA